jgi:hypothetical protein
MCGGTRVIQRAHAGQPGFLLCLAMVEALLAAGCRGDPSAKRAGKYVDSLRAERDARIAQARESVRRALPVAEQRWAAAAPRHYEIWLRYQCFCDSPPPAVVRVRNGSIENMRDTLGQLYPDSLKEGMSQTVPSLMAGIRSTLADTLWAISATFDERLGYPITTVTDHRKISDIGGRWSILRFRSLHP